MQHRDQFDAAKIGSPRSTTSDIWSERLEQRNRLGRIRSLTNNLQIVLVIDDRTDPVADHRMIVNDEHFTVASQAHTSILAASVRMQPTKAYNDVVRSEPFFRIGLHLSVVGSSSPANDTDMPGTHLNIGWPSLLARHPRGFQQPNGWSGGDPVPLV